MTKHIPPFSPEVRERAIRMVQEHQGEYGSPWAAMQSIAAKIGCSGETQRRWSDKAIARTTPCLLALFSIVTLLATRLSARERRQVAATAWYFKSQLTFFDALADIRRTI